MRYIPNTTSRAHRFNNGARPPLDQLPEALASLIRERDRILEQRAGAVAKVSALAGEHLDQAAKQADGDAAAIAARAGKALPKPIAQAKLEQDRDAATRDVAAQESALITVTSECDDLASKLYWKAQESAEATKAKHRANLEALAVKLADAVEAVVASGAVLDWMQSGVYYAHADTWPTDIIPELSRHALDRRNTQTYPLRQIITNAALTVLED